MENSSVTGRHYGRGVRDGNRVRGYKRATQGPLMVVELLQMSTMVMHAWKMHVIKLDRTK